MPTVYPGAGSVAEQQTIQRIRDVRARNGMFNPRLTMGADYTFLPGLKFLTTASVDAYFSNNHIFRPSLFEHHHQPFIRGECTHHDRHDAVGEYPHL